MCFICSELSMSRQNCKPSKIALRIYPMRTPCRAAKNVFSASCLTKCTSSYCSLHLLISPRTSPAFISTPAPHNYVSVKSCLVSPFCQLSFWVVTTLFHPSLVCQSHTLFHRPLFFILATNHSFIWFFAHSFLALITTFVHIELLSKYLLLSASIIIFLYHLLASF